MKIFYKLILGLGFIIVCVSFIVSVFAEGRLTIEELQEELNLTDAQVDDILPIIENDKQEKQAIIEKYQGGGEGSNSAMQEELKVLQKEHDSKYSEILTDEQMGNYTELRKQESKARKVESKSRRIEDRKMRDKTNRQDRGRVRTRRRKSAQ